MLQHETVLVQMNVKDKGQEDGKTREDDTIKYLRAENSKNESTRARETREVHHSQG